MQEIAVGLGEASPRAYGDSATAVLAMVHSPLPPTFCPSVLRGRFLGHMACEAASPASNNHIRLFIGHFAANGSVAGDDLWRSVAAFRVGGGLGVMTCRA
jgi:hypothetical protein